MRLEKWLDTDLRFLRDADQSYCTIDPNTQTEAPLPNNEELPIFKEKIKMKPPDQWMYNYHKSFPRPYNAFIEEHFLKDEWSGFNRVLSLSQIYLNIRKLFIGQVEKPPKMPKMYSDSPYDIAGFALGAYEKGRDRSLRWKSLDLL